MADPSDFERMMRLYNQRLFRACRSVLRDDAEAEDAAQEAWVLAWRHLDQVDDPARIGAWLTRIAVREALRRAHTLARATPVDQDEIAAEDTVTTHPTPSPERATSDREMGRRLEHAIDELPEQFRTVFVLRLVEELSVAETAECLDIAEETVKTRLHRARKRVADQLLAEAEGAARQVFSFDAERCDRIVAAVLRRIT
jgi:RNA polymerase sigma-70 factor (ECF subfamily)